MLVVTYIANAEKPQTFFLTKLLRVKKFERVWPFWFANDAKALETICEVSVLLFRLAIIRVTSRVVPEIECNKRRIFEILRIPQSVLRNLFGCVEAVLSVNTDVR